MATEFPFGWFVRSRNNCWAFVAHLAKKKKNKKKHVTIASLVVVAGYEVGGLSKSNMIIPKANLLSEI